MSVRNISFLNPWKWWQLARWLRRESVTTLLLNSPAELKLAASAARWAGVRQIIFRRGMPHPLGNYWLHRVLFRHCVTDVIANSEEIARSLNARNPNLVPSERIRVIYNGLDIDDFSPPESTELIERRPGEILLGNAGRLVRQKNQQVLLDMAQTLRQADTCFRLLIAGEGPLEEQLQERCQQMGLEENVQFLGFLTDIRPLLFGVDIFVFPSLYEGSANALLEAGAARLPVVAFDVSSNPEVVEDGVNGYLAPVNDIAAFTDHVQRLIQQPELRHKMGEAGRKRVEQQFSIARSRHQLKQLIS